jgi:diguanylate cyclase (GGDEF)-like protein
VKSEPVKSLEHPDTTDAWVSIGIGLESLINSKLKALIDSDISVITNDHLATTVKENHYHPEKEALLSSKLGINKIQSNNKKWIIFRFELSSRKNLDVLFIIDSNSAFMSHLTLTIDLLLTIMLAIGIGFIITLYLTRTIIEPLRTLTLIAEKIKQGHYNNQFPEASDIEIQKFSSEISSMQKSIEKRESEINALAFYDKLTGLPNRNFFLKNLDDLTKDPNQSILLILINLDRFKDVNDTLGHEMGDQLLILIAQRMKIFHFESAFYTHLGGDEFGILIWDMEFFDEKAIIAQYEYIFKLPYLIQGIHLDIDASFGITKYPEHAKTASGIMQCADIALHQCKLSHHNSIMFEPDMNNHSVQRLQLMTELRKAIESDQLTLYYQPKILLSSMTFTSVECLARWIHPEFGVISPDQFIPIAEQSGAIRDLTHWAIKTALFQQQRWQEQGLDLNIAVNISALDLIDLSLPSYVSDLLASTGSSPEKLTLEVTESAIMADPDAAFQALNMLRYMGIKLSIDDFGTGYSSLGQLKKLPVNELKIDQSFVKDLNHNIEDRMIIKSAADLSHNLNLSVVAEGVENEQSLWILKSLNIDIIQGYLIAKPMPSEELWNWYLSIKQTGGKYIPKSSPAKKML